MTNFFKGKTTILRPFDPANAAILAAEQLDSEAIRVFEPGIWPQRSLPAMQAWIERITSDPPDGITFFAVDNLEGTFVGTANIRAYTNRNGTFEYAIRIFREHQRRGYARDAVTTLLRYGFLELRCQKANAITIETNTASIALHQSLGFQIEGRLRRNVYTDGQYYDEICMGLTKEEWQEA